MKGEIRNVEDILSVVMQDEVFYEESGGGITLSGGEVLSQPTFARELLISAKNKNLHTCIETTGYAQKDIFLSVIEFADYILFDLKHWNAEKHKSGTGVSNEQIIENIKAAINLKKEVLPRIPIIPGYNVTIEDACRFSILLKGIGIPRCQLLPFHQFGENKYTLLNKDYEYNGVDALHREDLTDYLNTMKKHDIDAFF